MLMFLKVCITLIFWSNLRITGNFLKSLTRPWHVLPHSRRRPLSCCRLWSYISPQSIECSKKPWQTDIPQVCGNMATDHLRFYYLYPLLILDFKLLCYVIFKLTCLLAKNYCYTSVRLRGRYVPEHQFTIFKYGIWICSRELHRNTTEVQF